MWFLFRIGQNERIWRGWGWIPMRWFDRSSESKGERNDGDSPGFACYGYGYHGEEREEEEEEKEKEDQEEDQEKKEKKVIIQFMNQSINQSINQSMELEVGRYLSSNAFGFQMSFSFL